MKDEWICGVCEQVNQKAVKRCVGCCAAAELSAEDVEASAEALSGDDVAGLTVEPKGDSSEPTLKKAPEKVPETALETASEIALETVPEKALETAPEGPLEQWLAGITMGTSEQARPLALASIIVTAGLFVFLFVKALMAKDGLPLYAYAAPILPYMGCKIIYDVMHGKAVYMRVGLFNNKVREVTASYKNVYSRFLMLVLALTYILGGFYLLRL